MANLVLKIKDGKIVESNHLYEKSFNSKSTEANGWNVSLTKGGRIFCEAKRKYTDGEYTIRYVVNPNGYASLTLKVGDKKVVTLRKGFVSPQGEGIKNGTLTLAGGRIDERFAYFRCESFVNLLEKYDLKGIKHQNPNREYILENSFVHNKIREDEVYSDGKCEELRNEELSSSKHKSNGDYRNLKTVALKNATWAIYKSSDQRFLYTLETNVESLNLPV